MMGVQLECSKKNNVLQKRNCLETQSQGLPKSGFSSVGKLNFRDIFAGKKRTSLFTKTRLRRHTNAMQSQKTSTGAELKMTKKKRLWNKRPRGVSLAARAKNSFTQGTRRHCVRTCLFSTETCSDRQNKGSDLCSHRVLHKRTGEGRQNCTARQEPHATGACTKNKRMRQEVLKRNEREVGGEKKGQILFCLVLLELLH